MTHGGHLKTITLVQYLSAQAMEKQETSFFIPSSYSRIVARDLGLQERDLPRLLRGTGLPTEILLAGDESRMTGQQQVRVLANAQEIGNAPHFGLRLGRKLEPSTHGPIGYLALASPDLRTALQSLRDFLPIRIPFAQLDLNEDGQFLSCGLTILLQAGPNESQMLVESFVMIIQGLVESFLGRKLTEAMVHVDFPRPAYIDIYPQFIHSLVRFEQERSCVMIPSSLLREPNPAGNSDSYAAAREMCATLLEQVPPTSLSMTDRVKRILLAHPSGSVSEEDVARSLYVSKRTLARRLKQEGSGYRQVREEILSDMSARHLLDDRLSVESIAALLGYHDSANFRRAFRRWHGCSPQEFRRGTNTR